MTQTPCPAAAAQAQETDPLTGSLSQAAMEVRVAEALARSDTEAACLARLNLRRFKGINSLFGYATGNALLCLLHERLRAGLQEEAHHLGRLGGDEFAILFPGRKASEVAPQLQALTDSINQYVFLSGTHNLNVRVATGLIDLSPKFGNSGEVLFAAGRACRDARQDEHQVVVYKRCSAELHQHREILSLIDRLEAGADPDSLSLALQPILCLRNANCWGYEVLLRAQDSLDQPISPERIVTIAEELGMASSLDRWVLKTFLPWLERHRARVPQRCFFNVNLSLLSLSSPPFIEWLFHQLEQYPGLAHLLTVELTEGVGLEELNRSRHVIARLQDMGLRVALDDFGAGHTSLSYLHTLNTDVLKIDGRLVRNMLAHPRQQAIVRSIAQLAHELGMRCVAEWIEDDATLQAVRRMGIDYAQGYAIAPALALEQALTIRHTSQLQTTSAL